MSLRDSDGAPPLKRMLNGSSRSQKRGIRKRKQQARPIQHTPTKTFALQANLRQTEPSTKRRSGAHAARLTAELRPIPLLLLSSARLLPPAFQLGLVCVCSRALLLQLCHQGYHQRGKSSAEADKHTQRATEHELKAQN